MSDKEKSLQKREQETMNAVERTRSQKVFVPLVDISEKDDAIYLTADMPGIDEQSVDITLEKNVLTLEGRVDSTPPEGYELSYMEYETGDFQRSFTLSDEIDRERIEAHVKDGVLQVVLPKAEPAKARRIEVKVG
ncbi:Hsp20/alpha crystallin family protein [candidate division KSB1 bacterium]|nr:Hsp20/alpha crystallin family protein [candidate division KSB1 bacterium]